MLESPQYCLLFLRFSAPRRSAQIPCKAPTRLCSTRWIPPSWDLSLSTLGGNITFDGSGGAAVQGSINRNGAIQAISSFASYAVNPQGGLELSKFNPAGPGIFYNFA